MKAKILRTDAQLFIIEQYLDELAAVADVERALALAPTHADGLLERGILRRLRQDNDGARQDWLRVLRLAPKSRTAAASRRNLEKMDVNPDEPQGRNVPRPRRAGGEKAFGHHQKSRLA